MVEPVPKAKPLLAGVTAMLILAIFILDVLTPAGINIPLLYTIPLLFALLIPDRRFFLSVAATAAILTPFGFYFSPPGGVAWMGIVNRLMVVLALGVTAGFYWRLKSLQALLPFCSGCQKVRDDRGYWKQLELYLEEHAGTQFSRGLCPTCVQKEAKAISA
ncbi:MAG: hypothetical protein KGO52_02810 [Nitrospirota bacterium]|nr:hypothetical protein [Nitrospirota bacterium]MDE3035821.1 hypothetical protein [Nitrospirota bacterium]MDE3224817.1 hypothetical protein [Nitrospirota bacterium]MDE3241634.1 hypothetical protein [Nitrospirota bacterium]